MRSLAVDADRPDARVIDEAARVLQAGGLVAFPTETVYGLGALALDPRALERIFLAKGRPSSHPLIAHVEGEAGARTLAREWPESASRLARRFWPGPLTLVVPRESHVPAALSGGGDSVGVRAPAHPVARALLAATGAPLAAPSANRYQELSPTSAEHVVRGLGERVDLVLDAGPCPEGIESTVVDVRGAVARVLRPGALPLAALRAVLSDVCFEPEVVAESVARASPGMDRRHYAPRAPLLLAGSRADALRLAAERREQGDEVGLVVLGPHEPAEGSGLLVRALPSDPASYGRDLYAVLHELDRSGVRAIVVENVPDDEAWSAVADRLRRAAQHD